MQKNTINTQIESEFKITILSSYLGLSRVTDELECASLRYFILGQRHGLTINPVR